MRIINLIEDTDGREGCRAAHGLSFYVETGKHRLLMDLGPSEETLRNAEHLSIDLAMVDTVVLSHGHYDHSGGILPFAAVNPEAVIYMQEGADGAFYAADPAADGGLTYRYIGIDPEIRKLPQVKTVRGDCVIDEELELFTVRCGTRPVPSVNGRLKKKTENGYVQDDFTHEQCLVIRSEGCSILMSGCAHGGILNIMEAYRSRYGKDPDAVISGFHMMKKSEYTDREILEIAAAAEELKKSRSVFYTCHCTGVPAYAVMKKIMGRKLNYIHSGCEAELPDLRHRDCRGS